MVNSFKPKNKLSKLLLKIKNKKAYNEYKYQYREYKISNAREEALRSFRFNYGVLNLDRIVDIAEKKGVLNLSHAGNSGDIIYSLPTIRAIYNCLTIPINLYLVLDQPHDLNPLYTHPLGNVMLNQKMAEMLLPLLLETEYLSNVLIYQGQDVDIKLDSFREIGANLDRGNIVRWYNYALGVLPDLSRPWIEVEPNLEFSGYIVIARSGRYRNPHINYSFLKKYNKLLFLGVESEYRDILLSIPNIEWKQVNDFKQMAEIIAGSKFFIGNQSFPFSIAEALRVPRILETCFEAPNVIPEGNQGFDFYLQEHFEWLVEKLNDEKRNFL